MINDKVLLAGNEYLFVLSLTKTVTMRTVLIGISFCWARTSGT